MAAPASRPLGFWLKLLDRLIDEQFDDLLEEHGVTRRQWQLLSTLNQGPATLAELDTAVAPFLADHESSADHLAELVESAWVVRDGDRHELSPTGHTALEGLHAAVAKTRERTTAGLDEERYQATVDALEQMARNLGWTE